MTESGAFQSRKRPFEGKRLALVLGVPVTAKLGYDLAVLHEEWNKLDVKCAEPGVRLISSQLSNSSPLLGGDLERVRRQGAEEGARAAAGAAAPGRGRGRGLPEDHAREH